ncbi:LOW QUALITY PROTEIN: hypothetical protein U9M48_034878 [Paspalum notatum var. saurae]|uniref:Uncharacterized protein n=1 Tax=Paspalum notatum var. saurae TaxID=547442 RepID=A0AAQ3X7S3_PASNO
MASSEFSPPNPDWEPPADGGGEPRHELWRPGSGSSVPDHLDVEGPDDGDGDGLHLGDGELLAEADAEPRLEDGVPVEALGHEGSAGPREPSLGAEGVVVGAPDARHAAHGVGVVHDARAAGHVGAVGEHVGAGAELGVELHGREEAHVLVQHGVGVVQALEAVVGDVIPGGGGDLGAHGGGHGGVLGEEHEERGERGGDGVAAREEEADDDVAEVLVVDVDAVGRRRRPHEAGQEVVAVGDAELAALPDHGGGELVDERDGAPELPLGPHVEQALDLPQQRRRRRAAHRAEPRGGVEGAGELGHGHLALEAARVEAERDLADGVEGEAAEHVLQVDDDVAGVGGGGEGGEQPGLHLLRDDLVRVGAHGDAAELEAGHLALVAPGGAVDVEDAAAEEVAEERGEGGALGEVVEVGLEHVLDVGRVGGDGAAEDVDVDGGRGGGPEEVRVPVGEVGKVLGPGAGEARHTWQLHHGHRRTSSSTRPSAATQAAAAKNAMPAHCAAAAAQLGEE